jgi:hypothetical protein
MSGTTAPAAPATTKATLEASAIKAAQDLPDLLAKLQAVDSPLADQITGKSLVSSKTPVVTLLVTGIAWVSARYGLGWDESTDTAIAGAALLAASYAMRFVSTTPITGLFAPKSGATTATKGTTL